MFRCDKNETLSNHEKYCLDCSFIVNKIKAENHKKFIYKNKVKRYEEKKGDPFFKIARRLQNKVQLRKTNLSKPKKIRRRLRGLVAHMIRKHINMKSSYVKKSEKYEIDYQGIIEHLKPFPEDISKYHIDHIKPLCSFNFIDENGRIDYNEISRAFSPENHQWLTIKENLSKGGKF